MTQTADTHAADLTSALRLLLDAAIAQTRQRDAAAMCAGCRLAQSPLPHADATPAFKREGRWVHVLTQRESGRRTQEGCAARGIWAAVCAEGGHSPEERR